MGFTRQQRHGPEADSCAGIPLPGMGANNFTEQEIQQHITDVVMSPSGGAHLFEVSLGEFI
eukprot:scaffold189520_cov47-Prasinocladus_malaysianus.AAC.2